ncbi:MAG: hypothetical protein WA875_15880 [Candidatus Acidiferrales bacterium]
MIQRAGSVLILGACALMLSGCMLRNAGPCYGFGCPSFTSPLGPGATPQPRQSVAASQPASKPGMPAQAETKPPAQPVAQSEAKPKPGPAQTVKAFVKKLLPSRHSSDAQGSAVSGK